ncbi:MAG: c-type cytochrome [Beijerinckiaceae bacterium]|nr:c-type cytochrome [Beijerinckiaceae bacterium]
MRFCFAALAALALTIDAAAAQDAARGEKLFEACQSCHSLDPAKAGMAGPHLARLKGRVVGSAEGFDYSPAFRAAKAQGWVWDEARLAAYLADPDSVVKGGWMSAPGLDDAAERAAVAAFLLRP